MTSDFDNPCRDSPGRPGQHSKSRTAMYWTARTSHRRQDLRDRIAGTRQIRQNSRGRESRRGQSGWYCAVESGGRSEHDSKDKAACHDRINGTGHKGQDSCDRMSGTGQLGQVSMDK